MNSKKTSNKKNPKKLGTKLFYSIGSIFILVLAAFAFVFIPAATTRSTGQEIIVGKWDKKPIKYEANSKFVKNIENLSNMYKQQGYDINDQTFYYVFNEAFTMTVINMAVMDEIEKSGFIPSEKTVNRSLLPYFFDTQGKYSAKLFNDTSNSRKIELKTNIIEDLKFSSYITDYFSSAEEPYYGLKTASNESKTIAKMNAEKKGFNFISFSTYDYPKTQAVNFAKENAELFTTYNFSLISFDNESEAKSTLKQLEKNEITFEDAIQNFSTKSYSDNEGKFNYTYYYEIKPLLTEDNLQAILDTPVTNYSPIIQIANNYYVFRLNENPVKPDFSDESIEDHALSYMIQYEMGRVQDYFTGLANDFALNASINDFETAAEKYELEVKTLEPFALNYGNSELLYAVPSDYYDELINAERNDSFLKSVFSLKEGEISNPIILGSNILICQCTQDIYELEDSDIENASFTYAYYANQYNENSFSNYFLQSDKTENKVFQVYLEYFLQ